MSFSYLQILWCNTGRLSHQEINAENYCGQVGRLDLVLEIGRKMLNHKDSAHMKRDILLSMALAKLGQADELFSTSTEVHYFGDVTTQ